MNIARLTLKGITKSKAMRFRDDIERLKGHTNLTSEWLFNRMRKLLLPGNYVACETCGISTSWEGITIDHKIPRTAEREYRGNIHGVENLELVCPTCNSLKGQKSFLEFLDFLNERNEKIIELRKMPGTKEIVAPLFPQIGLGLMIFGPDGSTERVLAHKKKRSKQKRRKSRRS